MTEWHGLRSQSGPNPCNGLVVPHQLRLPRAPPSPALSTYRDGAPTALWTAWATEASQPLTMEFLPYVSPPVLRSRRIKDIQESHNPFTSLTTCSVSDSSTPHLTKQDSSEPYNVMQQQYALKNTARV